MVVLRLALHHDFFMQGAALNAFNFLFVVVFTGVSRVVFGQLVEQTTFPLPPQEGPGNGRPESLLAYARHPVSAGRDLDERDLMVRNRAYFYAFRFIAIYSALLWIAYSFVTRISLQAAALLLLPLIVMAITLPQAVVLWTEPDVPAFEDELAESA